MASPTSEGLKGVPSIRIGPPATPLLKTPGVKPLDPRAATEPAASVAPVAAPKRGLLFGIVGAILVVVGVSAWLLLKKDGTFAPSAPAAAPTVPAAAAPKAPVSAAPVAPTAVTPSPAVAKPQTPPVPAAAQQATPAKPAPVKPEPVVLEPGRKGPSADLQEKVRTLPITGAAGGGSQRLSVAGKVFEPGDMVLEGLILQAIENEEIVFRDAEGNIYSRRL